MYVTSKKYKRNSKTNKIKNNPKNKSKYFLDSILTIWKYNINKYIHLNLKTI